MSDSIINSISVIPVTATYPHELGRNSRNMEVGRSVLEWIVKADTSDGSSGLTIAQQFMSPRNGGRVSELVLLLQETLMGKRVTDLLLLDGDVVVGPGNDYKTLFHKHGWLSILAYDLVGKQLGVSAVTLLGGFKRRYVPAYDTTLYFDDLRVPEKGVQQVVQEAQQSVEAGWNQIKIKIGRCGTWMSPEPGQIRDAEIVNSIREAVGKDVKLMVDANFGYEGRLDLLENFIMETKEANIFWLEEMVLPNVDSYRAMRNMVETAKTNSLLVCGEVDREPISEIYKDLASEGLMDGYQPDIVSIGFSGWKAIENSLEKYNVRSQPHCFFNGVFGTRASIIFGAASDTFMSVEDERCSPHIFKPDHFEFKDGSYYVPDVPGLGLEIDEEIYIGKYASNSVVLH